MNKIQKIVIAILGGIDTVVYLFTPMILAALWITVAGLGRWESIFFYFVASFASLFRAYKIGFME